MRPIPLSEILIPENRQRRDFDPLKLQELADSIDAHGLLHAVVVRPAPNGSGWFLVAGERRIRAIRDYLLPLGSHLRYGPDVLDDGYVPALALSELDPLAAEEAELEENIRRVDLTWPERAAATARLADLRTRQAVAKGDAPPTTAVIAEEVRGRSDGDFQEQTRRELLIAKHLDDPAIAGAKSLNEAWKALKRNEQAKKNAELAISVGATFTAETHRVFHADAADWLVDCPDETFDVILTDPPYGMGADEFGDSGGAAKGEHSYEDSKEVFRDALRALCIHGWRITKAQAHLYMFCDIDGFLEARDAFEMAGWWVHRTPLVWHKPLGSRVPWPEHGPQRKYEFILYAVKGKKPVTRIYPDVLTYNSDPNLGHEAQKPVALYVDLLKRSCVPGDHVLDCFMGSGPIFPAAHELKVRATGVEKSASSYGLALNRIKALKETA